MNIVSPQVSCFLFIITCNLLETQTSSTIHRRQKFSAEKEALDFSQDVEWQVWKSLHYKNYGSSETESNSYHIWKANLRQITWHNQRFMQGHRTYIKGLNGFSDTLSGDVMGMLTSFSRASRRGEELDAVSVMEADVPSAIDWRKLPGLNDSVRFQGFYPNAWLFTGLDLIQFQLFLRTGQRLTFSPQELVDCFHPFGYHYGSALSVFSYVRIRGISLESDYPFRYQKAKYCKENRRRISVDTLSMHRLTPGDENNLKRAVALIGPIAVNIRVTENFVTYSAGVFHDGSCGNDKGTNHAAVVMGYGTDILGGDFWILKNSWGTSWGENGYMRIARNTMHNCGITSVAVYAVLQ